MSIYIRKIVLLLLLTSGFALAQNVVKYQMTDDGTELDLGVAVKVDASGDILACGADDHDVIGLITAKETSGGTRYYLVSSSDLAYIPLPNTVLSGDKLTTTAGGGLGTASSDEIIVGIALEDGDGNALTFEKVMITIGFSDAWYFFRQIRADGNAWLSDSVTIISGSNITLTQQNDSITIDASGGASADTDWARTGNYVYTINTSDSVGIGTSSPNYDLHITGDAGIFGGLYDGAGFGDDGQVLTADGAEGMAWEDLDSCYYQETFDNFSSPASNSWETIHLSGYGVEPGALCEIVIKNNKGNDLSAGVREVGSGNNRRINLDGQELFGGADVTPTMHVVADSDTCIEVFAENNGVIDFYLIGWQNCLGSGGGAGGSVDFQRLRAKDNPWLTDSVTLVDGSNITLTQTGDSITIASTGGGDFERLRANNASWLTDSVTLVEGMNITLTQAGDSITITGSGAGADNDWNRTGNFVYTFNNTDSVGIGTANPTEKFHVNGNALVGDTLFIGAVEKDSITDSILVLGNDGRVAWMGKNDIGGIQASIKLQCRDTVPVGAASTWLSFKFDTLLANESRGSAISWPIGNDSTRVLINEDGLYLIGSNVHFEDISSGNNWRLVLSRVLKNSTEVPGLQGAWRGFAPYEAFLNVNSTIYCVANDTLELQYNANRTQFIFTTDDQFDEVFAAIMWIQKLR